MKKYYFTKQYHRDATTNHAPYKRKSSAIKEAERMLLNQLVEKVEIIEWDGKQSQTVVATLIRG